MYYRAPKEPNAPRMLVVRALALVVQKMNGAIHRISLYPGDSAIGFSNAYPVNSTIQLLNKWALDSVSSDVPANLHP